MNLEEFRDHTKSAEGKCELVIVSSDTRYVYELVLISVCMNDPVVLLHAKAVEPGDTMSFAFQSIREELAKTQAELATANAKLEALRKDGLAF